LIVGRLEQSVDRHRNRADLDGAEKTDGELGAVEQEQEDALLNADTSLRKPFPKRFTSSRAGGN